MQTMIFRRGFIITAALVCHLLLRPPLVTSQWTPEATRDSRDGAAPASPIVHRKVPEEVTIQAREQEKAGDVFKLRGDVEITFRNFVVRADEITYNSTSGEITASGHFVFDGGPHDEHITATHGNYNVHSESGTFYDVVGSTGARMRGRKVILTSSNPFLFTGRKVEKVGRDRIVVHHGAVTSCTLPNPKWTFNAERVVVVPGEDAKIYNSTFRLFRIPIFYFPFAAHPVERLGRQSGFLIPTIGQSSRKGTTLGESFYWAMNRSMDATLGAEYYSTRGWAQHGQYRAKFSDTSSLTLNYFGVIDRGLRSGQDQGGREVRLNADGLFARGIRGVAGIEYLSSFVFRLAFSETFAQAVNSEVRSTAFLSDNYRGFSANMMAARYQNFQSSTRGDLITIVHTPSFELSSVDRRIPATPLHWSFEGELGGVSRREPDFVTPNVVGRFDLQPRLSLPLVWRGLSFRPEVALRETLYTDRLAPSATTVGRPIPDTVNRRALELGAELRPPPLTRIFNGEFMGRKIKHTVEPRIVYRYVRGVDNFRSIIRFDARDILSDSNEVEYAIVNRLYAKRVGAANCAAQELPPVEDNAGDQALPVAKLATGDSKLESAKQEAGSCGVSREIVSWELGQKYFFDPNFGGAVINGRRNVFTTTAEFTGIAFLTEPRRFSPLISRLRVRATGAADIEWHVDYDPVNGRMSSSTALVNYKVSNLTFGGGHTFLHAPGEVIVSQPLPAPEKFNQFRTLVRYGDPNKRGWNAGTTIGFDANLHFLQYTATQITHNWDCCGITVEYRRFALGSVRNENVFRFALTLANVGTFGNLKRQERLF